MDRTEWMYEAEVNRPHHENGRRVLKWIRKNVQEIDKSEDVRCMFCKGAIRLHQGPKIKWHAEHQDAGDAAKCPGSPVGKVRRRMTPPTSA